MAAQHSPFGRDIIHVPGDTSALELGAAAPLRSANTAFQQHAELSDMRKGLDETAATARLQEQRMRKQRASIREILRQLEEAEQRVDGVQRRVDSASKSLEKIGRTVDVHERTSVQLEQRVPAISFKLDVGRACAPSMAEAAGGKASCGLGESQDIEELEKRLSQKFDRRLAEEADRRAVGQQEVLGVLSQGVQQLRMEHARHVSDFDEKLRSEQRKFRQRVSESQTRHAEHESRADSLETRLDSILQTYAIVEHQATRKTGFGEERKKVHLLDRSPSVPADCRKTSGSIHPVVSLDATPRLHSAGEKPSILEKTTSETIFAQKEAQPHNAHFSSSNQTLLQTHHHAHCNTLGDVPFNLQGQHHGFHNLKEFHQELTNTPAAEVFTFNAPTMTNAPAAIVSGAEKVKNCEPRQLQCKHIPGQNEWARDNHHQHREVKFPEFNEWVKRHESQHESLGADQRSSVREESTQALQHEHRQLHDRHIQHSTHVRALERHDTVSHELNPQPSNNHGHVQHSARDPSTEHHDAHHQHRHHHRHTHHSAHSKQDRHRRHGEHERSLEHSANSQDHHGHSQHKTHKIHGNSNDNPATRESDSQAQPNNPHEWRQPQQQLQHHQIQSTHHPHPEVLDRLQALEARIRDSSQQRRRGEDPSAQAETEAGIPARKRPSEVPVTVEVAQTREATSQASTPRLANYPQNQLPLHSSLHAPEGISCQHPAVGLAPPKGLSFESLSLPSPIGSGTLTAMQPNAIMTLQADPLNHSAMTVNIVPAVLTPASPASLQHAPAVAGTASAVQSGTTPRSGMPESPGRQAVLARARPVVMLPPAPSSIVSEASMEMTGRSSLGSPSGGPFQLRSEHSPQSPSAMSSCSSPPMPPPPQPLRDTPSFAMRLPSPPRTPLSTRAMGNGH